MTSDEAFDLIEEATGTLDEDHVAEVAALLMLWGEYGGEAKDIVRDVLAASVVVATVERAT